MTCKKTNKENILNCFTKMLTESIMQKKKSFPDISGSVKYNFFSGHSFSGKLKYANWSCFDIFTVLEDDNTVTVGNMANKNRNNIN